VKIHALTTGTVRLKHAFLYASEGRRRQLDLLLCAQWSALGPIHCWAIEDDGWLLLVDTGETADVAIHRRGWQPLVTRPKEADHG
jgi:hypothetical protein